jgi:hypothetical protein
MSAVARYGLFARDNVPDCPPLIGVAPQLALERNHPSATNMVKVRAFAYMEDL